MTGRPKIVARNGLGPDAERLTNYLVKLGDIERLLKYQVSSELLPQSM